MESNLAVPTDFAGLLKLWPNVGVLARDMELPYSTVRAWQNRVSIPARAWNGVISSAQKHGISGITVETMAALVRPEKPRLRT